jgi:iron complex outermembrane receptor protein
VTQALTAAGFPTFSGLQFFTNAADTRTKGIELTGRYDIPLGAVGEVDLTAGYNRSDTEITSIKPPPSALAGSGLVLIGHEARGVIEGASPGSSARIAADYALKRFSAHLSAVRFGAYQALNSTSATLDQTFSPQTIVNLQAGYRFGELLRVAAGVDNLFNSHPDQVIPGARNPVVSLYSGLSPEGGAGSFWYVRASLSFR